MKKSDLIFQIKGLFHAIGGMVFIVSMLCSITAVMIVVTCITKKELHKYQQYYQASETLLDSLESNFNWIDAYDPGHAYDEYIKAREGL